MNIKKELFEVVTVSDVKLLSGSKGKTSNHWVSKVSHRITSGGVILMKLEDILPVINKYRVKKGMESITKEIAIKILKGEPWTDT